MPPYKVAAEANAEDKMMNKAMAAPKASVAAPAEMDSVRPPVAAPA